MVGGLLTAILFELLLSREGGRRETEKRTQVISTFVYLKIFTNLAKLNPREKFFFLWLVKLFPTKTFFSLLIREILSRKVCFWLSPRLQRPYHKLRVYYFDVLFITMRWKTQNLVLSSIHVYFQHFNPIVFEIFVRKYLFFLNSRT